MSWETVDTSRMQTVRRPQQVSNVGVFRMEQGIPFEPGMFSWNARTPNGRSRVQPVGVSREMPPAMGDEMVPLIKGNRRRPSDSFSTTTAVVLCAGVTLWVLLIGLMATLYWNFTSSMNVARDEFRPYIYSALNHTMSILRNTDEASLGAHGVLDGAEQLSNQAIPAIQHALNQSAAMIDRLERLAQNPVLQISLQQGALGGAAGVGR